MRCHQIVSPSEHACPCFQVLLQLCSLVTGFSILSHTEGIATTYTCSTRYVATLSSHYCLYAPAVWTFFENLPCTHGRQMWRMDGYSNVSNSPFIYTNQTAITIQFTFETLDIHTHLQYDALLPVSLSENIFPELSMLW